MVGLEKAEARRRMHPIEQLGIGGAVGSTVGRYAANTGMHARNARNHRFGTAAGPVHRHHRGEAGALQPIQRPRLKRCVLPLRIRGSANSNTTAMTPPMNSASGFLNTVHEIESAATNAGSPRG